MQKTFLYNGTKVAYRVEGGAGQPVVLIHGFAEDGTVWDNQRTFLKDHCRLIIPDLPGSGLSDFASINTENATIEYFSEYINALLEQESISSCIMLGHSLGGYITLAFAEKFPGKLTGFGLVHSTAFADTTEKKISRRKGIEAIEKYGAYSFIKNTTPNLFAAPFKKSNPGKIEVLIEAGKNFSPTALQQYYTAMMNRPDRTAILKESKVPVLFIIGKEDVAAPLTDLLQQVYLPAIAYIHVLDNSGHMGIWEEPGLVNDYLLNFIKATE